MRNKAFLFGPFIGSLSWEMYRFAPYAIFLKKQEPRTKLIVMTRPERFDLYGQHADILVPLRLKGEESYRQEGFSLEDFSLDTYELIKSSFFNQYKQKFSIKNMFCPNIREFMFKIKWQFPRDKMNYDFKPRQTNKELIEKIDKQPTFVDFSWVKQPNDRNLLLNYLSKFSFVSSTDIQKISFGENASLLGCVIEVIKRSKVAIGNLNSPISHLSILLGTKLVSIDDRMSDDDVHLLNPLKTEVVRYNNVLERLKSVR